LDIKVSEDDWIAIATVLESYVLRRAVCGLTTKNYNRIFLALTRSLRRDGVSVTNFPKQVSDLSGESSEWPTDATFAAAWRTRHVYQTLNNAKVVYIFRRLNDTYMSPKMESLTFDTVMTIEHILPQTWVAGWPLPDGSKGLAYQQLWSADPADVRVAASELRNSALQTFGNLTVLSQALNSSASNAPWSEKRPELMRHSLLPINQQLGDKDSWDEAAIRERGDALLGRALEVWPHP